VDAFSWHGRLLSPLAIGTGVEHPLENGHLFFDPHGLPFIPGSSVKGVLRRAAEELALFEDGGSARCKWTIPLVWLLFGFDQNAAYLRRVQPNAEMSRPWREAFGRHVDTLGEAGLAPLARQDGVVRALRDHFGDDTRPPEALVRALLERLRRDQGGQENGRDLEVLRLRGALDCWDAFFVPPRMRVDIMNPHYGAYYQTEGWTPPHETSPPNPIYFLAVDAGVRARFHVQWRPPARTTLPDGVDWKDLVASAFEHAARNLGFGAKTSVGYGRFESTDARSGTAGSAGGGGAMPQGPQRGQPGGAGGPSGGQVAVEKEHRTSVSRSLGSGEITAQVPGGVARWRPSPQGGDLSSLMPDELAQRLTRQNELPNVIVRYREDGNQRTILAVRAPDPTPPATRGGQS
jgi:CRISPR-associated protein Cmr6